MRMAALHSQGAGWSWLWTFTKRAAVTPGRIGAALSARSDAAVPRTGAAVAPLAEVADSARVWAPEKMPPQVMASALLDWLQAPDGQSGVILAVDLMRIWRELCLWNGWLDSNWRDTAKEFRRLIGGPDRQYCDHKGKRAVCYVVRDAEGMLRLGASHADRHGPLKRAA